MWHDLSSGGNPGSIHIRNLYCITLVTSAMSFTYKYSVNQIIHASMVDGKYVNSYLMTMVICAISVTIYNIIANPIKYQTFDFEKIQGHGKQGENEKCAIRLSMFYFFSTLVISQNTVTHSWAHAHFYTSTHRRQRDTCAMTKGKICNTL